MRKLFSPSLEKKILHGVDALMANIPQPRPTAEKIKACKLVSHRGEHGNHGVLENTLPAFEEVLKRGIWGLEFDIRWSNDGHPVVAHDDSCQRVFDKTVRLSETSFKDICALVPGIPPAATVIERFGKKLHLMIELKTDGHPLNSRQKDTLRELLSGLTPMEDYHILSLKPQEAFVGLDFVPSKALMAVGELNIRTISQYALEKPVGGIMGHYLLLTDGLKRKHESIGQKVGTGFISSTNVLWREINRGVEWVFSNNAVAVMDIINREIQRD